MRLIGVTLIATALGGAACSDTSGPAGGHSTTISVLDNFFTPSPDTVAAGTVTFSWGGAATHNVTWDSGPTMPASITPRSSGSVDVTVAAGTYNYHCSLHAGMNGVIVVQ